MKDPFITKNYSYNMDSEENKALKFYLINATKFTIVKIIFLIVREEATNPRIKLMGT